MGQVTWTNEASRWLEDIFSYIATDSPAAAVRIVERLYERVQDLISYPEMGYRYLPSPRHVRIVLYGHYRIAYLVNDNGDVVILGVFHGSLDISRYEL